MLKEERQVVIYVKNPEKSKGNELKLWNLVISTNFNL